MKQLTVSDFITSKEAGTIFNKHENTIMRVMKRYFVDGVDYRKIGDREQLLIRRDSIEAFYKNESSFRGDTSHLEKKDLEDRFYRI